MQDRGFAVNLHRKFFGYLAFQRGVGDRLKRIGMRTVRSRRQRVARKRLPIAAVHTVQIPGNAGERGTLYRQRYAAVCPIAVGIGCIAVRCRNGGRSRRGRIYGNAFRNVQLGDKARGVKRLRFDVAFKAGGKLRLLRLVIHEPIGRRCAVRVQQAIADLFNLARACIVDVDRHDGIFFVITAEFGIVLCGSAAGNALGNVDV